MPPRAQSEFRRTSIERTRGHRITCHTCNPPLDSDGANIIAALLSRHSTLARAAAASHRAIATTVANRRENVMRRLLTMLAAMLLITDAPAQAQDAPRAQVDRLARDVSRVQSLRAVKDLQRFYAQYG